MNLKKLAALLLAVLLLVSTLAGCGQKVEDPVEPPLNTIDPAVTEVPPETTPEPTTTEPTTTPEPVTTEPTTTPEVTTEPTTVSEETTTKKTSKDDYTVEAMSGIMYATISLNVRKGPSTDFSKIGSLSQGQAVTVTGRASTGWYEIDFNGEKGYVSNVYMSTDAPSEKPAEVTKQTNSSDDDDESEDLDETPGSNQGTTGGTPSVTPGNVTAGDWVKDNYAEYMFGKFTDERYKIAMNNLAKAVQNLEPTVDLGVSLSKDEMDDLVNYIAPMVGTTYCYFSCVDGGTLHSLSLSYYVSNADEAKTMMSNLEKAGKKVVDKCSSYSDYNKVKYIYEWIIKNSKYEHGNYYASPYGPIVDGRGTCMGYAKATFYLLSMAGFDCVYGVGKGVNDTHIWVKANIGGKWYNIDTGWGDPTSATEKDPTYVGYEFLCVTDDYMINTRSGVYNLSKYFTSPDATSNSLNWFVLNDCYITSADDFESVLKAATSQAVKDTSSEYVYVRIQCSTQALYEEFAAYYGASGVMQSEIVSKVTKSRKVYSRMYEKDEVKKTRTYVFRLSKT